MQENPGGGHAVYGRLVTNRCQSFFFFSGGSHRPYDIINIYHSHVKLVKVDREEIDFPQPEEVLSESEVGAQ